MTLNSLHILTSMDPAFGGPPTAMLGLGSAMLAEGLGVCVISTGGNDIDLQYLDKLDRQGAYTHVVGPTKTPLGLHPDLKAVVKQEVRKSDIVHIHGVWEQIQHLGARLAYKYNKPYIFRACGMLDPWCMAESRIRKQAYMALRLRKNLQQARAIHFTTTTERDTTEVDGLKEKAIVEPNGINITEYSPLAQRGLLRNAYPAIGDQQYVLYLSRVHHKKGPDLLIQAFKQANLPNTCLVIAGPGEADYIGKLKQIATELRIADKVHFVGPLHGDMKMDAYQDAGLFALPSYQENFGNVVLESLACGTPVLISDQVNLFPELAPRQLCLTCTTNPQSIAEQIKRWHTDPHASVIMRKTGREYVQERYDWQSIAKRWAIHYSSIIAGL